MKKTATTNRIDIDKVKTYHKRALKEITHQKKTENALYHSYDILQKVLENTTNAIFLIDLDGNFSFSNKACSRICGYDADELKGQHFSILFNHKSFTRANELFNEKVSRGRNISQYETSIVCKNGKKRSITFSLAPILQKDKVTSIVGTAEDITKHKYTEKQLRLHAIEHEALSHLSRMLAQAESEKFIYDQVPQIISNFFGFEFVSIELYDIKTDEIIFMGSKGITLSDKTSKRAPATGTVSGNVIRSGNAVILTDVANQLNYKFKLLEKLNIKLFACFPMKIKRNVIGTLCLGSVEKEYIHQSMNIILQTIADTIAQAIENKQSETKIKEYQLHLEELVDKRTEQLRATQEKLIHTAKLSAVGKLSASIAHEFNNPICGIRNVLERISGRIEGGLDLDGTHKELTSLAIKECNRVTDLIRKLQEFHRPSSGKTTMMNIQDAIDEILLLSKKKLDERKITIYKHYSQNIPNINAVSDQIKQVILNIVQNAEEAIPEKGGKIIITTEMADSNIKIHINDNGCRIPRQNINTIFEPFFTTKQSVKGTGLGLSISYGIIKKHGGNINVESLLGKGTTFTIMLPVKTKY